MPSTQNNNSDEIDLRDLFGTISKGVSNFFGKIINFIVLIRRTTLSNLRLFAIIIVLFLISAFSYSQYIKKNIYASYMIIQSEYLNKQLVDNIISKLDLLSQEENKSTLSDVLGIDINTAELINGFEVESFVTETDILEIEILKNKLVNLNLEDAVINSITQKMKIHNLNMFKIIVFTETNSILPVLDSAISNYFLQDNYIKKRIEINREILTKRKDKLEKEQSKINNLKSVIFEVYQSISKNQSKSKGSDNIIFGGQEVTNPLDIFKEDLRINERILDIEEDLSLKNEFEVVEGLTPFSKPVSVSRFQFVFYAGLIAIGFTYILIALIELNHFFAEREKELG